MKVNDPNPGALSSAQIGGSQAIDSGASKQRKVSGEAAAGDRVSLSSLGAKLRELDAESPERAAYLERLSAEVQSGRYHVDAHEVSRKIVGDAIDGKGPDSKPVDG